MIPDGGTRFVIPDGGTRFVIPDGGMRFVIPDGGSGAFGGRHVARRDARESPGQTGPVLADPLRELSHPARDWFETTLGVPTRAQVLGLPPIIAGASTLLLSPTGSGKTLAAFLSAIDRLMNAPEPTREARCRVLYVSPLKALAVDIERNLRAPIVGICQAARRLGQTVRVPSVGVRTGDTPQAERARMRKTPPDILITTPESLFLLLTSDTRRILASVETVIVDEIHSLVPSKRGAHLFLSLERLHALRGRERPLQRIGLSATQRPLEEVARLLVGFDEDSLQRPVTIIDAAQKKPLRLAVEMPEVALPEITAESDRLQGTASGPPSRGPAGARSVWPAVHARLVALIREHRTTMIFVNSRRLAERLASALNDLAGVELALAHHGSVAREKRQIIEERLKSGLLAAIVATSSLELGLDIGAVDLVVQIEAPPSIASGLQRIGRAHHHVGGTPQGLIVPKHKSDLLATAAAVRRMLEGDVEATFYPRNPLDVLAQQLVAMCAVEAHDVDDLYRAVRQAAPFAELPRSAFEGVLDMLAGRYPSDEFPDLKPRLVWDRVANTVRARAGALRLAVTNAGTIADRGLYGVFLAGEDGPRGGRRVGELDEEMVFELREGEVFLLGASSWRAEQITHDRVLVTPAPGEPGKMPFWHGDRPGRPLPFGQAVGALTRLLAETARAPAEALLREHHHLDQRAASALTEYVHEQVAAGEVPTDRGIVIERFLDEVGDHRVCVLSPFGSRVHAPWSIAVTDRLRARRVGDIESVWSDDGMVFRIPASDEPPPSEWFLPSADDVESEVKRALEGTSLFAARFREAAGRALLLPRRHPTRRQPLWAQRKRAADLLAVAARHASFPIVLETYRECLRDVFDLPGLVGILQDIEKRRIRVRTVDTGAPSPFAASLLFSFVANFVYEGDAPLAERRAQALTIDHERLRELLGEAELRSLLDPEIIAGHERFLQRLAYPAKDADSLCDVLRGLGDLSLAELCERSTSAAAAELWLAQLEREQRVFPARIQREARFVAAEDAGRYRDALGIVPPPGTPSAFLGAVPDALSQLVSRYGRTHGPFQQQALCERYGLSAHSVSEVVARLRQSGRLVSGAFLAKQQGDELCDAEVLRTLRQRSLAHLRREVEPVEPVVLARFLVEYQGATRPRSGDAALLDAIAQLEGCPLPASALLNDILPARVRGVTPRDLDALCNSGEVVWAGIEPIGSHDGRIALYLTEHEALLSRAIRPLETEQALSIRATLARRGAVFFPDILRETGGFPGEVLSSLWDMVWSGEVTNDSLEALRSMLVPSSPRRGSDMRASRLRATRRNHARLAGSEGRWSLRSARWAEAPSDTDRRAALGRSLLDRYGVVTREVAQAEAIDGGFSSVYEVLKAMESAGRIRRGYFVAGHGGVQFALPGADEDLRAQRTPKPEAARALLLSAVDPASPYGALLPWPERIGDADGGRLARVAGAYVALFQGALVGYLSKAGDALTTFSQEPYLASDRALASALAAWASAQPLRRAFQLASIDGLPAAQHPLAKAFQEAGFAAAGGGLLLSLRNRGSAPSSEPEPEEPDAGG